MPIYSSDSDDHPAPSRKPLGHRRPLHDILGGGKVADILLWKNKNLSLAILIGATAVWFLFEVVEYQFVTLLCHLILAFMTIIFIWSHLADLIQRDPPDVYKFQLSEIACRSLFRKIDRLFSTVYDISSGDDWKMFFRAIAFLWMLSVLGNYVSSLNLLYFGFVCMETVPALYERFEDEVDYLADKSSKDVKKLYKKFDSKVLNKIPRGPAKENRYT
ncbi:Reticulon-like protein [Psidium guajava]|nr:Reticulon-like protein [Psidium guajava]